MRLRGLVRTARLRFDVADDEETADEEAPHCFAGVSDQKAQIYSLTDQYCERYGQRLEVNFPDYDRSRPIAGRDVGRRFTGERRLSSLQNAVSRDD